MNVWAFVVVLQLTNGPVISEAFDYTNALACQEKRESVVAYLLDEQRVAEFYVGDCQKLTMSKKS